MHKWWSGKGLADRRNRAPGYAGRAGLVTEAGGRVNPALGRPEHLDRGYRERVRRQLTQHR
jgi:hypothetical protein